jgi:hypothetical protein
MTGIWDSPAGQLVGQTQRIGEFLSAGNARQ